MFHGNIHRHLLVLSLVNWAIAIVCWTISAYLGTARPTNLIVYTVLFVVGLFAVIVAVGSFVLADFGTEPEPAVAGRRRRRRRARGRRARRPTRRAGPGA